MLFKDYFEKKKEKKRTREGGNLHRIHHTEVFMCSSIIRYLSLRSECVSFSIGPTTVYRDRLQIMTALYLWTIPRVLVEAV